MTDDREPRSFSGPPLSDRVLPPEVLGMPQDPELLARAWQRVDRSLATGRWRAGGMRGGIRGLRLQAGMAAALFLLGVLAGRWGIDSGRPGEAGPEVSSEGMVLSGQQTAPPGPRSDHAVEAPEESVRSSRGSSVRIPPSRHASRRPSSPPPDGLSEQGAAPGEGSEASVVPSIQPEPTTPERANWLVLAERGDFAAAFSELDHDGTFQAVLEASSAEELMTLADVARFAGRQGRAILALRQVTERYRDDPNAPLAAMMLGNLLSRAGDSEGARAAYALNRALSPDGDFAEDALVRELDLVLSGRDLTRALQLLQKYRQQFPSGSRLASFSAKVELLSEELAEEAAAASAAQHHTSEGPQVDAAGEPPTDGEGSVVPDSGRRGDDERSPELPAQDAPERE